MRSAIFGRRRIIEDAEEAEPDGHDEIIAKQYQLDYYEG
jgi:hypothetical protein